MWKESFLYQCALLCWIGKAPVCPWPAAHQQCQGGHKVSLVTVGSLSRLCHTWEHPFNQLLGELAICPWYFQNSLCWYKHESAYIQKLGKYTTCHAQTLVTSDRSPFESLNLFFFFVVVGVFGLYLTAAITISFSF